VTQVPAYIRYFTCTDGSGIGALALELAKSMLNIAPVRAISMTGVLVDEWMKYANLTLTPMVGSYVNVVACDPSRWTWVTKVPMPEKDAWQSAVADVEVQGMGEIEYATERKSLYTANVRNVLYAIAPPRSMVELKAVSKFEAVIVPNKTHHTWWLEHAQRETRIIGYPMLDSAVREVILGTS
jgi:hypothetical protein